MKGTWCALPDDGPHLTQQQEPNENPDVLDLLDPYTNTIDDGNLLKLQALESEKKEDLPLAVASPDHDGSDGSTLVAEEKPVYTEEKKGRAWPCWAKLICLLLLLLLGIATATLVVLARMHRTNRHTIATSRSQNEELVSTFVPTPTPTAKPTKSPSLRPTPRPTSSPVAIAQASLFDGYDVECPYGPLTTFSCFFEWIIS